MFIIYRGPRFHVFLEFGGGLVGTNLVKKLNECFLGIEPLSRVVFAGDGTLQFAIENPREAPSEKYYGKAEFLEYLNFMRDSYDAIRRDVSRYGFVESEQKYRALREKFVSLKQFIQDEC